MRLINRNRDYLNRFRGIFIPKRLYSTEDIRKKFAFPRSNVKIKDLKNPLSASPEDVVIVNGWIDKKPKKMSKNLMFGNLRDSNGDIIQLVDSNSLLRGIQPESAVVATGRLEKNSANSNTDLKIEKIQVLNKSGIVGSQLTTGSTKDWPAEHRYLELRTSSILQRNLQRRAKMMSIVRRMLDDMGFTEIETPMLFKSTPEGAREFLVPTRKKNYMYALPQSPQQYKQLLMASGVHRYYQIARCFRDEDLRQDRQPEFTQLDLEMSFAQAEDVQETIETLIKALLDQVISKPVWSMDPQTNLLTNNTNKTFHKLTYKEAISRFGIDKPDLRSSLEIIDISEYVKSENEEFPVMEAVVLKNAVDNTNSNVVEEKLTDPTQYGSRIPEIITDFSSSPLLAEKLNVQPGDLVAISNRQTLSYENPTPLGRLRQIAISLFPDHYHRKTDTGEYLSNDDFVANWITDFPLFNPTEAESTLYPKYNYKSYETTHHPFTMAHLDDIDSLFTDPLRVRGQHYDLVINGVEVGGGSTRIHDAELQKYVLEKILCVPRPEKLFGHLLRALDTGCPPHAGLAIGFDRLTAMLCETLSIRDVIAFPKTITGADPMIGCPSKMESEKLRPYHIKLA